MSRYPWNEKPERYAQLDQERRMTTDHTNDETPEAPPAYRNAWACTHCANVDGKHSFGCINRSIDLPAPHKEPCTHAVMSILPVCDWCGHVEREEQEPALLDITEEQARFIAEHGEEFNAFMQAGQPTEPPPLPDGWTKESYDDGYDTYTTYASGGFRVRIWSHPRSIITILRGTCEPAELHAVLAHHLGLTAPAADVRAALVKLDELRTAVDVSALAHRDASLLDRKLSEIASLLTGKGAPL